MLKRVSSILWSWVLPALLVAAAALSTLPWSRWVVRAAYEQHVERNAAALADRVRIQAYSSWYWFSPEQILEPLKAELLGDPTVQAVWFVDYRSGNGAFVRRNESIPIPRSVPDIEHLLDADPASYRKKFTWEQSNGRRGIVYMDLSRDELQKQFDHLYRPLQVKVKTLTASGSVILCILGILAYRLWTRAARQRRRAELEQQGLLAERVLTAAVLAHEIRNPLAALRFQLHSLRRNAADPDRVGATADTIDSELGRIQKLVQEYLAHENAQAMEVRPVHLADAVRTLQSIMDELLRHTGTRLTVTRNAPRVVVACDPHALRQVLMNLVLNAQQAMGRGGTIHITIDQQSRWGTIAVADNGPGIPPEIRDRLFKPFITSRKEGSGIGLALVKRFVDNFGGSVSVESEPGKGTTFFLKLPLAGPEGGGQPLPAIVAETRTPEQMVSLEQRIG